MASDIAEQSLLRFLDALASRASTPGGGSAAAVMGAMGAALVGMVCRLTIGKKGYEAVGAELEGVLARAEAARAGLTAMIAGDVEAFDRVMAAYAMARETDAQRAARADAVQAALREATLVPLACARLCKDVIELSGIAAGKGNRTAVGDAGVAALAAHAALRSAALNVHVNVGAITDQGFVAARLAELAAIVEGQAEVTDRVCRAAGERP